MLCQRCPNDGILLVVHTPLGDTRRHTDVLCPKCLAALGKKRVHSVRTVEEMEEKYGKYDEPA